VNGFRATVQQELIGSSRERMPQALLVVFLGMVSVSSLIGWISNRTVTEVYENVRDAGLTTAENPFTHVSPLSYARNDVIYIVLIGALLAIVLGVSSILRGRKARIMDLVLSRPIDVRAYLMAKLTGMSIWIALIMLAGAVIGWASISTIYGRPLSLDDTLRLLAFFGISWLFLQVWVVLGMVSALYSGRETTALLVPIIAWSVVTFVAPQLGTAALPVSLLNPVPAIPVGGGPFATVHSILGPISLGEDLKTAGGALLRNDAVTGNAGLAVVGITIALAFGVALLLATRRERLRSELRE
jgi:ABC-2 type transport system permease protein